MIDDMGIFRTTIALSPIGSPQPRLELRDVMVDTGSEFTWVPRPTLEQMRIEPQRVERFETADGRVLTREVGFAMLYVGDRSAPAIVAFAEEGDMVLLGAVSLESLNLKIDLVRRELVPAGPIPVASAA